MAKAPTKSDQPFRTAKAAARYEAAMSKKGPPKSRVHKQSEQLISRKASASAAKRTGASDISYTGRGRLSYNAAM
jgi:hypothetical protein